MKKINLLLIATAVSFFAAGQVPIYDTGVINTNQVSALFTAEGTLNFKSSDVPAYFVPKDSMTVTIFCGALWVGGYDKGHQLHIAAQTYHQNGTDFWPGPMMDSINYSPHQDSAWNHVWLIYKSTIDSFREGKFGSNIPASILNWPGNGNISLGERGVLAPYVDSNHNGYYDPTGGDYPLIRGDEALYTIFNDDRGPAHTETKGKKLGIEVHLMAYQFNSADTTINETTFLHYDIFNFSKNNYDSVYYGSWIDMDVGNGDDNLIGCDSANNYWYTYDGHAYDANGSGAYASEKGFLWSPPAQSLAYLCDTMTHFMYYTNSEDSLIGNPITPLDYYFYMEDVWEDSVHATYGGSGLGGTTPSNYMFSGNPDSASEWSEITARDVPGDRRGQSSIGPYTLNSGERKSLDLALVFSRGKDTYGNVYPVTQLGPRITDVKNFYNAQSYGCDETMLAVPEIKSTVSGTTVLVYPNPTSGIFTVVLSHAELVSASQPFVEIYNVIGQKVTVATLKQVQGDNLVDLSSQPSGIYFYRVLTADGKLIGDGKIVKQ